MKWIAEPKEAFANDVDMRISALSLQLFQLVTDEATEIVWNPLCADRVCVLVQ